MEPFKNMARCAQALPKTLFYSLRDFERETTVPDR
jgi:hypothetical protein